jgi:hypothetical protein
MYFLQSFVTIQIYPVYSLVYEGITASRTVNSTNFLTSSVNRLYNADMKWT